MNENQEFKIKFPIRRKLILLISVLLLICVSLVSLFEYYYGKEILKERILKDLNSLADSRQDQLESILKYNFEVLKEFSSRTKVRGFLAKADSSKALNQDLNPGEMSVILQDANDAMISVNRIDLISLSGKIVASTTPEAIGTNLSDQAFFVKGKSAWGMSNIYYLDNLPVYDVCGLVFSQVKEQKGPVGLVRMTVDGKDLFDVLTDHVGLGKTGEIVLGMRKADEIIFFGPLSYGKLGESKFQFPLKSNLAEPMRQALSGNTGILGGLDYKGTKVLSAYRSISYNGWGLVVKFDEQEAFSPVEKLLGYTLIVDGLMLLFGIAAALVFAEFLSRPVNKLHQAAEVISRGNLDYKIEIESTDELGQLGSAFNQMAINLKKVLASRDELNKALRAVEQLHQERDLMISSMSEGVAMLDRNCRVSYVNHVGRELLCIAEDETITDQLFSEKLLQAGLGEVISVCKQSQTMVCKEIISKERNNLVIRCSACPVSDDKGELRGMVLILRDITKEKAVDRMKSEFISTVSHELRTPLAITKEGLNLILDGIAGEISQKQKTILNASRDNIDRLTRLINDLLDISKIEAGRVELRKELVSINQLINKVVADFQMKAEAKGIELRTSLPDAEVKLYLDPDRMIQVFTNLISNAIRFTRQGYVEVVLKELDGSVECAVNDTGSGIAKEDLPRVFGKFEQFSRTYGPGEKGTGLGLALSKNFVEMHNGRIWVESELGKGTRFIFVLPKHSKEEALRQNIEQRVVLARKDHKDFSVFIYRMDNFDQLNQELEGNAENFFVQLTNDLKLILRSKEGVVVKNDNELIVMAECRRFEVALMNSRIVRGIKQSIIGFFGKMDVMFSYGYSTYPDDAGSARELLEKTRAAILNETAIRLDKHIMIVDDEVDLVKTLRLNLENLGYKNISQAYDGEEALRKIEKSIPDLIILDMRMPGMSGYEVIGRLKEDTKTKDIPILIISGFVVEIDKIRDYIEKKAIPMISKPFNIDQVKKIVDYLL